MTKKKIHQFQINGNARDNGWILKNQPMLESYFDDYMRERGYVPVLDKDVKLIYKFNTTTQLFDYALMRKAVRADGRKWLGYISADQLMVSNDLSEVELAN